MALVATGSNFFIIDLKNNILWMRFDQGSNYALGSDANNNPSATFAHNSHLFVATNGSSVATNPVQHLYQTLTQALTQTILPTLANGVSNLYWASVAGVERQVTLLTTAATTVAQGISTVSFTYYTWSYNLNHAINAALGTGITTSATVITHQVETGYQAAVDALQATGDHVPGLAGAAAKATAAGLSATGHTIGATAHQIATHTTEVSRATAAILNEGISRSTSRISQTTHQLMAPRLASIQRATKKWEIKISLISAILFDKEPTVITNLTVAQTGRDYVVIAWDTNHYGTSKVSYGDDYDYGLDVQSTEYVKHHVIKIEGLEPGRTYYYEVMSQSKNYVFDARHEFRTAE